MRGQLYRIEKRLLVHSNVAVDSALESTQAKDYVAFNEPITLHTS
jgi:hypothetical protein